MYKIDFDGFWTIKHITCGATFEITGQKIRESKQPIKCSNCGIPIDTEMLKNGVDKIHTALIDIDRASKSPREPYDQLWQIYPPIKVVEEEKPLKIARIF